MTVSNYLFIQDNAWRGFVGLHDRIGVDNASNKLKTGSFIAPSRRTVERLLLSLLSSVTMRLTFYIMPINTTKAGGAKVVKETKRAKEAQKVKLEFRKSGVADKTPVSHDCDEAVTPTNSCEKEGNILETEDLAVERSSGVPPENKYTAKTVATHYPNHRRSASQLNGSEMHNSTPGNTTAQDKKLLSHAEEPNCPL